MATYWHTDVQTYREGKPGCSCSSGHTTLSEALARAVKDASYYVLTCGYDVTIELIELCLRCQNTSKVTVRGSRSVKSVRCPECRGKHPMGHIPVFPFKIHENSIADLAGRTI